MGPAIRPKVTGVHAEARGRKNTLLEICVDSPGEIAMKRRATPRWRNIDSEVRRSAEIEKAGKPGPATLWRRDRNVLQTTMSSCREQEEVNDNKKMKGKQCTERARTNR